MYECPLCGATSNRKGAPFESPEAVVGHISAKRDEAHRDSTGEELREDIARADDHPTDESAEPERLEVEATNDPLAADAPPERGRSKRVELSSDEVDEMVATVEQEAREQGYEAGLEDVQADPNESERPADDTHSADESGRETYTPDECPQCGEAILDGDTLVTMAEQGAKQGDTNWRKWVRANRDAEIAYACRDLAGCGYYVDEDNYARTFDQPGSVLGTLAKGAAYGMAGVAAIIGGAALAGKQNQGGHREDWRQF